MNKRSMQTIVILSILILFIAGIAKSQQNVEIPIPSGAQIVIWMRVNQVATEPDLRTVLLENNAFSRYLELMNLDLSQIDRLTLFMPFDKTWFNGTKLVTIPQTLPKNGAFIISGNFNPKDEYQSFKSKGWKETSYSNKKVLWWSTGSGYYLDPKGSDCIGMLPGGGLVVAGSEESIKNVLDVAGGKTPSMQENSTFQFLSHDFDSDSTNLASAFLLITPEIRNMIKADTVAIKSSTARAALSYIDYLNEAGLSAALGGNGYILSGYLGMDTESNALVIASIFQIGGGLAPLLPPNSPNRNILENMNASKQGKMVILQSNLSRQQMLNLLKQYR